MPPGTPTLPCQGAMRSGGMISATAEPAERTSDKRTTVVGPYSFRAAVKRMTPLGGKLGTRLINGLLLGRTILLQQPTFSHLALRVLLSLRERIKVRGRGMKRCRS